MNKIITSRLLTILLFICAGIITYFPSLRAQMFWDDDDFITHNQYIHNHVISAFFTAQAVEGAGKVSNYFRPLQFTIYAIMYAFVGMNTVAFHAVSIVLHISATIALYLFLKKLLLFFDLSYSKASWLSVIVSLIFLIHPLQTEAVTYVSGMSDPLVALFGFLSSYFFIPSSRTFTRPSRRYLVSLILFILALLSKETGIIFLGIIITISLIHLIPLKSHHSQLTPLRLWLCRGMATHPSTNSGSRTSLRDNLPLMYIIPYAIITLAYLIYHRYVIDIVNLATIYGDSPYTHSVFVRVSTFFSLIPTYISLLFFPLRLFYDRDFSITILTTPWHLESILVVFVVCTILCSLIIHLCQKKNSESLVLLFTFVSFWICLIPFSGLTLINGIMYEHFLYLALPFFFLFVFLLLLTSQSTLPRLAIFVTSTPSIFIFLLIPLLLLIIRSWQRQYDWQEPVRFYTQTLHYVPTSFRVMNNLGLTYKYQGKTDLALQTFQQAISANPAIPNPYHNIGTIYLDQKKYDLAETYFKKAIQVDPSFGYSYASLIEVYQQTGNKEQLKKISEEITKKFK